MKKVYLEVGVQVILMMDEDADLDELVSEMNCEFSTDSDKADILAADVAGAKVLDVK